MPTYEYACTACGERLEVVQKFTDAALTECPSCAGKLRKVFSAVGVVFKGSGFYKTDSRSNGGKTGSSSEKTSSNGDGKSEAKTESKSDSKSETKTESKPSESKPATSTSAPAAKPAAAAS